jgi:hypothetical protein
VQKKTALYVGGAAVAIGGVVYWREKKMGTATTTTDTTATGDIDPATGFVYGTPEDVAALASQGTSLGSVGGVTNTGGGGGVPPSGTGSYATNGQWSQAAIEYMVNNGLVADPTQLSAALGKYITGAYADPIAQQLIDQAIGVQGYPPVAGLNGFPPAINTNATPTTPAGQPFPRPPAPKASGLSRTGVTVSIPAMTGATLYEWSINGANHQHTTSPSYHYGMKPGTTANISVAAHYGANIGPESPQTKVTTPK